eukprot:CAMPEP_0179250612 /NCGR_PEP_ID=MMETSP0797-20121207/21260_1 /TAXON_ID=47934 /ORGANISM="Dinophysis acuminata, Strain DAEP01" /LENGTH=179 /DNA_ID=CAMNT_0020958359 /DNA_START=47 /DNA_END=583 /DNA_ORIENTATION=-
MKAATDLRRRSAHPPSADLPLGEDLVVLAGQLLLGLRQLGRLGPALVVLILGMLGAPLQLLHLRAEVVDVVVHLLAQLVQLLLERLQRRLHVALLVQQELLDGVVVPAAVWALPVRGSLDLEVVRVDVPGPLPGGGGRAEGQEERGDDGARPPRPVHGFGGGVQRPQEDYSIRCTQTPV